MTNERRGRRLLTGVTGAVLTVAGASMLGGIAFFSLSGVAYAGGSITASPDTGLTNGESVTVTGSGFADSSPGEILECNNSPTEPYITNSTTGNVSVGCTAPSLTKGLTSTSSTGTLNTTYTVETGTIGPPCGQSGDIIGTCPSTDSAGLSPTTDAANYPCPPTTAQQAEGVTCTLSFGDAAGDAAQTVILFSGETTSSTTTTTTTTTSTPTSTTSSTSSSTTTTTSTPTSTTSSTSSPSTTTTTTPGSTTSTTAAATTTVASSTETSTVSTSSSGLAFTGPGAGIRLTATIGAGLLILGVLLLLIVDAPRQLLHRLVSVRPGQATSAIRPGLRQLLGTLGHPAALIERANGCIQTFSKQASRVASDASRWLTGR